MRLQTEELIDKLRLAAPEDRPFIEDLLHHMPRWVEEADRMGDIPDGFWSHVSTRLLNRLNLAAEYGGLRSTSTALRRAVLFERIGRICPALPIGFPGPGLSMMPVLSLGSESQRREYFRLFLESDRPVWGAFAITEPQGGSDATTLRTRAIPRGDHYELSGTKCFVTNGRRAEVFVAFATVAPEKGRFGIRAFVIRKGCPGLSVDRCEDMMGLRASQLASVTFNGCSVPREDMLGHTGERGPLVDAFVGAQSAWNYMRPALAALIVGACAGILDHAESVLRADEQAVTRSSAAHALVELPYLRARVQSARLLALRAAWKYDNEQSASVDASLAKAHSSTLAMDIANSLTRIFPLASVISGNPIEKFYRDAKAFDILEGTGDMQRLMIARSFQDTLN